MEQLKNHLKTRPVIYVTRDRERAEGLVLENNEVTAGYSIITSLTAPVDTFELLNLPEVQKEIVAGNGTNAADIIVFKNTTRIEEKAKELGVRVLNPSATLAEKIENKITQVTWLGELAKYLPPHKILTAKDISFEKDASGKNIPFIAQWAHSHTGTGTILVATDAALVEIQKTFPDREVRVTQYINGPMLTVNIVVSPEKILVGNISYQITGTLPFTENPFSTIGNDWSVTHSILDESQLEQFNAIAIDIAKKMQQENWRGLFGIDVIYDIERNSLHLIEINARQPASTTFESKLQLANRALGVPGMTVFEAHLCALLGLPLESGLIYVNDGSQIIQRITSKKIPNLINRAESLSEAGYTVIPYQNTKQNSDLLRIQSSLGIMEAFNKFNKRGLQIIELITK